MNAIELTQMYLSERFNIEASEEQVESLMNDLDEIGQAWLETATPEEVAEWATGVLCNMLPDRDGNY
jgi:hypothetical protein